MKVFNDKNKPIVVGGQVIEPGCYGNISDEADLQNLLDEGVSVEGVTIKDSPPKPLSFSREQLILLPMKELREIGAKVGAKDTSKAELVEEILTKTKE